MKSMTDKIHNGLASTASKSVLIIIAILLLTVFVVISSSTVKSGTGVSKQAETTKMHAAAVPGNTCLTPAAY